MIEETILDAETEEKQTEYRLASVIANSKDGVQIQFEGEDTATDKLYHAISSYKPVVGDRVVTVRFSGTYIILGGLKAAEPVGSYISTSEKGRANGVATLNGSGYVVQKAVSASEADSATSADRLNNKLESSLSVQTAQYLSGRHTGGSLGFFNVSPGSRRSIGTLASSATLPTTVSKVNELIGYLKYYGLLG